MGLDHPTIIATREEREKNRLADTDFSDGVLLSWERDGQRASLEWKEDEGVGTMGTSPWWPTYRPDAKPGDRIRIYGRFGSEVRGVDLWRDDAWIPIWYRTQREIDAEWGYWVVSHQIRQRRRWEKEGEELRARVTALHPDLRRRMERFFTEDPDFGWTSASYEMAAVSEADRLLKRVNDPGFGLELKRRGVRIMKDGGRSQDLYTATDDQLTADWEDTPENRLLAFDAMNSKPNGYDYTAMKEIMPEMDDGHSGNTWGAAVWMALAIIRGDGEKL